MKLVIKRILLLTLAIVLLSSLSLAAFASEVPESGYELIFPIPDDIAKQLKPVHQSNEVDGIRLEVLSAAVDGGTAFLHIALSDLTGNRIDRTVDLFDSYGLDLPCGCMSQCRTVDYTPESKTTTFLLIIQRDDEGTIEPANLTFGISRLLTNKTNFDEAITGVDLTAAQVNPDMRTDFLFRFADYSDEEAVRDIPMLLMRADQADEHEIMNGVTLTKIGFVNNRLRAQFRYDDILKTDNHGFPSLLAKDGSHVQPLLKVSYFDENRVDCYEECVFDVSPETVGDYALYGEFTTSEALIEGNWQVTFSLGK